MISIFTTKTDPINRGDTILEAQVCYEDFADELVVVNGRHGRSMQYEGHKEVAFDWPQEFSWEFIGEQFQRGYDACSGDWCIRMDLDMLFNQNDFGKIRQAFKDFPQVPAISFYKWQFILPDRYNLKSRLIIAVNKKMFGDRIKFNGGGDLCQPTLDGKLIDLEEMPQAGVPIYNYEKILKTKEQIMDDQGRMERAWKRHFGEYQMSKNGSDEEAYKAWYNMQQGRFNKPSEKIPLSAHPKYIQGTISGLKPDQFGYNGFGLVEGKVYA